FAAYRVNVSRVANQLSMAGRKEDAKRILNRVDSMLSQSSYPYNPYTLEMFDASAYFMATAYYNAGDNVKAAKVASQFVENLEKDIAWILSLGDDGKEQLTRDAQQDVSLINEFSRLAQSRGDTAFAKKMNDKTDMLIQKMSKELNMESMMGPRQ
ncbi:MAG TPA: hypothetical protein VEB40_05725, partial [Flavipsychrobacter sp.]|nr:hypothetical protein [Flavipsychrobacter sp.]